MKPDSNTEMELLLRRHARRSSGTLVHGASDDAARSNETASDEAHLDADEMNAYAEGELPAAARAHMLTHLADCDRCRALVTSLTLAANVSVKYPETDAGPSASPKRSWREWLSMLFAPPVIRYGVPALVALCVVGVVFLALRQREAERKSNEPTLVARNNEPREGQTASANRPEASPPTTTTATSASPASRSGEEQPPPAQSKDAQTAQNNPALADTQTTARAKEANEATPTGASKSGALASSAPVTSNGSSRGEAARDKSDEDLAAAAPRPAAPPAEVSQARAQEQTETDTLRRNPKDSGPSDDRPATSGIVSNTSAREAEEKTASLSKPAQSAEGRRRAARRMETLTDGADERAAGSAGQRSQETRSVGGRKFRRQGGAWVDTAYASGRATVNVTRGSEQYRALLADEPGLRAIADQLGGEVIVVWKGRAYRIH